MLINRLVILFNGIPFIHRNNHAFSTLMCNTGNLGILLRNTFCRIYDKNHHIRSFHRSNGTDNTVTFQFFLNFALTAKSRSIDKDILPAVINNRRINGISCCSCNIRNNHALFADHLINNR